MDALREARRPTLAYGSRVRHCLRGRWFSLVPVQRTTLAKVFAVLALVVLALVIANDGTVRFVAIADRAQLVDVFQIMRHGSLGRYFIGVMYLGLAGAAWMVYQLRRFRNDDFSGDYRLWQWIVGIALVSSVATLVPLVAMLGAAVEGMMGRRIALSGQDWIGLFLIIGGAILAMKSVAEMWRYRAALTLLIAGWLWAAVPIAVDWNVLSTHTNLRWTVVTSAPLLAVACWFAATASYLRSLYREVRGITAPISLLEKLRIAAQQRKIESNIRSEDSAQSRTSKADRDTAGAPTAKRRASQSASSSKLDRRKVDNDGSDAQARDETTAIPANTKRRWFGLRRPAKTAEDDVTASSEASNDPAKENDEASSSDDSVKLDTKPDAVQAKRRWWQRRPRKPKPETGHEDESSTASDDTQPDQRPENEGQSVKKRRSGLGSMMKRKSAESQDAPSEEDSDAETEMSPASNRSRPPQQSSSSGSGEDETDDPSQLSAEDVDWSSMNKSERRKMRKQLKRSGRAA